VDDDGGSYSIGDAAPQIRTFEPCQGCGQISDELFQHMELQTSGMRMCVPQKAYHGLIPLKRWLSAPRPKGILNIQLTTSMFESSRIQQHCLLDRLHPKFDPTADQNWFFGPPCFFASYLRRCPKSWGHSKNHGWFISWKISSVYTYLCYKIVFLIL